MVWTIQHLYYISKFQNYGWTLLSYVCIWHENNIISVRVSLLVIGSCILVETTRILSFMSRFQFHSIPFYSIFYLKLKVCHRVIIIILTLELQYNTMTTLLFLAMEKRKKKWNRSLSLKKFMISSHIYKF
jgi:hypothetical protein